ncbi:hypothetical protein OAB03_00935 [Planktomarina temperata]|nr:hypothetical protein [bacterium]MDB9765867.1 hypothetical protein [Planktomarina temperata]
MKRHFRSKLLVVRRYLAIVWTQINYYIYDPSKPSKAEFLKLSDEDQLAWIEANVPKYVEKLYGDNYLGCSYEIDEDTVDEYLEYREDYNVLGLIGKQLPNISDERIDEIDEGAELTDEELEALRNGIAENDESGWDLHSGFYFKVRFGALYGLFVGHERGQGGCDFELERVFANKQLALQQVSEKPMVAIEIR